MTRVLYGLIFILIALPAAARQAQEPPPWYEVEIILFGNLDPAALESEQWPQDVVKPDLSDSIELLHQATDTAAAETDSQGSAEMPVPYQILPRERYQLNEAYQRLSESEEYLPYLHVAWRQIVPPREKPDRIFVYDDTAATPTPIALSATDIFAGDMLADLPLALRPAVNTLSGIISIGVGRYLHVNADLLLYKPRQDDNDMADAFSDTPDFKELQQPLPFANELGIPELQPEAESLPEYFRIQGDLRMRSGEVHYLDHPLVGMLILFTPYTPPEPEEEPTADSVSSDQPLVSPNQSGSVATPQ